MKNRFKLAAATFLVTAFISGNLLGDEATTQKPVARLFILSGQSNMVSLNPDNSFVPALKTAFPDDRIVVVKDAENGQPLRRWYAREQPRDLYKRLFEKVQPAMKDESFASVTFVWMQGEADASWAKDSGRYEAHLKGLIQQLRSDLKREDMTVVIGRISDHFSSTDHGDKVRQIQVDLAESDSLVGWIDTDDLAMQPDGVHYATEGSEELSRRMAMEAAKLIKEQQTAQKGTQP